MSSESDCLQKVLQNYLNVSIVELGCSCICGNSCLAVDRLMDMQQ